MYTRVALKFSLYILSFLGKTLNHECSMSIVSICMLIHSHIAHPCCAHQYNLLLNLEILFKGIAMTISWKLLNCFDRILPNHSQHCLANSCALCANLISFFLRWEWRFKIQIVQAPCFWYVKVNGYVRVTERLTRVKQNKTSTQVKYTWLWLSEI